MEPCNYTGSTPFKKMYKKLLTITNKLLFTLLLTNSLLYSSSWLTLVRSYTVFPKAIACTTTDTNSPFAPFYNPATLSIIKNNTSSLMYATGIMGENIFGLIYQHALRDFNLAGGLINYRIGESTLEWIEYGTLHSREVVLQNDTILFLSWGTHFTDKFSIGTNLKLARSVLIEEHNSYALSLDFSSIYNLTKNISLAFSIQNFGHATAYHRTPEKLPLNLWFGCIFSKKFNDKKIALGLETSYLLYDRNFLGSIAFSLTKKFFTFFLSFNSIAISPLSCGASIDIKNIKINYSYTPAINLHHYHHISVSLPLELIAKYHLSTP